MKKVFSIALMLSMMILGAEAVTPNESYSTVNRTVNRDVLNQEIEARLDSLIDEIVYPQLEDQGRLDHLNYYREILYPDIQFEVYNEYGIYDDKILITPFGDDDEVPEPPEYYNIPNGGFISYYLPENGNYRVECGVLYLEKERTLDYYLQSKSISIRSILENILGTAFSKIGVLQTINQVISDYTWDKIMNENTWNARFYSTYAESTETGSTVLMPWSTYPRSATIPHNAENWFCFVFPPYEES